MSLIKIIKDNIYLSERVGKNGNPITIPKIRTMCHGAEKEFKKIVINRPRDQSGKILKDPRILPNRNWLRNTHLDEIPQLFYNVIIKRNMHLVGIRARNTEYWETLPNQHKKRALKEKPSLMGVNYANTNTHFLKTERRYLAEKRLAKIPALIDLKYAFKIIYNETILRHKNP